MIKLYTSLFLLFAVAFYSCRSAGKSFDKGNYNDALELGLKKLQKDPTDAATRELVQNAYKYLSARYEDGIRTLSASSSDSRFEKIYSQYVSLQNLYNTVHAYPAAASLITVSDYSSYVETYRDKAVETRVQRGRQWMTEGTKQSAKEAYAEFAAALRLRPDDIEIRRMRDDAYESAVTRIVVVPVQNYGNYRYASSYQLANFYTDVMRTLAYNMNNDFVKLYSESDARSRDIRPDQVMELSLGRITIGEPYDKRQTREVSKQVVVKETVYKTGKGGADSVVKEYGTVRARITTVNRTLVSRGELYIVLRDPPGRIIWNDNFTGEHQWQTSFTTFTGDERALSETDRRDLDSRTTSRNLPSEEAIVNDVLRQIQNDLSYRVRNYYSRY
jgi:tetratricopeptide (TPR) repeat protein